MRWLMHSFNGISAMKDSVGLRQDFPGDVFHQHGWLPLKSSSQIRWFGKIHQDFSIPAKELHVGLITTDHSKSSDLLLRPQRCFRSGFKQVEVFGNANPAFV